MGELTFIPNSTSKSVSQQETQKNVTDEQRLIAKVALGDETALQELLAIHGEMLARLVGRMTAWHADSDDILQEVLLVVWRKADSYQGNGSLEGWLKRIAVNRCQNYFRTLNSIKRKIEKFASSLSGDSQTTLSVYESEKNEAQSSELQQSLTQLSSSDRSVLVLYYLEEMPGDEVASVLGIKPETLHVRLHRARKKLKKQMEQNKLDRLA